MRFVQGLNTIHHLTNVSKNRNRETQDSSLIVTSNTVTCAKNKVRFPLEQNVKRGSRLR